MVCPLHSMHQFHAVLLKVKQTLSSMSRDSAQGLWYQQLDSDNALAEVFGLKIARAVELLTCQELRYLPVSRQA